MGVTSVGPSEKTTKSTVGINSLFLFVDFGIITLSDEQLSLALSR